MLRTHGRVAEPSEIRDDPSPSPEGSDSHENHVHWHGDCSLSLSGFPGLRAQSAPCSAIGDDGFRATGVCCAPTTLTIPTFPQFKAVGASYICVNNCATSTVFAVNLFLSPMMPTTPTCDVFSAVLTLLPVAPATSPSVVIPLKLKYSRTWTTTDSFGRVRQVWRCLANGEASYGVGDPTPCPTPMCTLQMFSPWFQGFIDFASPPSPASPGPSQGCAIRVVLGHRAGCISHANDPMFNMQALSPTDPNRHDDYAFFIVAPTPFTPATAVSPLPPTSLIDVPAGTAWDAVRTNLSVIPATTACLEEDLMHDVKIQTVMTDCYCTPMATGAKPLHYHQDLIGMGTCPPRATFQSIANLPTAPPTGFDQEYVGRWALGAGLWPFKGHAWLAGGVVDSSDIACNFPSLQPSFHFVWGGTTVNGMEDSPPFMTLFGGGSGLHLMTDIVNSLFFDPMAMTQSPMVGTVVDSALLIQVSR